MWKPVMILQMQFHTRDEKTCRFDSWIIEKSVDGGQTFPQMQSVLCIYGALITHIHETIK